MKISLSLLAFELILATASTFGADNGSATSNTLETPKPYTDQGTTTSRVETYYDPGLRYLSGFNNGYYGFSPFPNVSSTTVTTQYRPIFFPPAPPALGEPVPKKAGGDELKKFAAPFSLEDFVYEPFYAPLSTLLFTEDLDRRRRAKIDAYRSERSNAIVALRAKIDALANADEPTRTRELAAFAREQTPQLAALEKTAEEIRDNLVSGGFFQTTNDWNDTRRWRLGDNTRWESTADELKVMRAAAFFQEGLSPAQRRLLRELAMELADSLATPGNDIALDAPGPFFYFFPETARIRLPLDLPAELSAKLDAYTGLKSELKRELRDELYKQDRSFWAHTRVNALRDLATRQAGRLAQLETMAEEIRVGLAPLPNPARAPALALPSDLVARLNAYVARKSAWQREVLAKIEELRAQFPEDRVDSFRQGMGLAIQIVANRKSSRETTSRRNAIQADLNAFNTAHVQTYLELLREKEALQNDTLKAASAHAGRTPNKSIEQLLAEFNYAFSLQERWERYRDYDLAALQPGLSPEQRRLLFAAALQKLDLPLNAN